MGPRLLGLAALLARRYGPWAVTRLARAAQAWLGDPANARTRDELVRQLRSWAARASGSAAAAAGRLADEVGRRRLTVGAWERELIARRMELGAAATAPEREAALVAYAEEAEAATAILSEMPRRDSLRRIEEALAAERGMLATERLTESDRARALRALDRALAACRRTVGA